MNENEFIELREISYGSICRCILIYSIRSRELFILKKPYENESEFEKLIERETSNYQKIIHPFLPKFYGTVEGKKCIIIEYINGQTLDRIDLKSLTYENRLIIIFELMLIINYFHYNKMIYRDLKPNNIIIDENKHIVLIDFDRLIEDNQLIEHTMDLGESYTDPEITETRKFTFSSDIYSLGKIIKYIFDETNLNSNIDFIINKCVNERSENRPSISELIEYFSSNIQNEIQIENIKSNFKELFHTFKKMNRITKHKNSKIKILKFLNYIYHNRIFVTKNDNKAINYLSLAAEQNDTKSQFELGLFYGAHKNIDKAIYFLSLSAAKNNPEANFYLGNIYHIGEFVAKDMNKAFQYYSIASNSNHSYAQFNLGLLYLTGNLLRKI